MSTVVIAIIRNEVGEPRAVLEVQPPCRHAANVELHSWIEDQNEVDATFGAIDIIVGAEDFAEQGFGATGWGTLILVEFAGDAQNPVLEIAACTMNDQPPLCLWADPEMECL